VSLVRELSLKTGSFLVMVVVIFWSLGRLKYQL
jgi:hypothetical protein